MTVISVAQVDNLPYRRLAVGTATGNSPVCGLPIRDRADGQPAVP
jgi:hypothetical protein